jgi:nitrogen fixation NifU-like protein
MEVEDLYQDLIIDHGTKPRNFVEMPNCSCSAEGYNPLCGDKLKIFIMLDQQHQHIQQLTFIGQGCAISTASASILTQELQGIEVSQALQISNNFKDILVEGANNNLDGKLAMLANVKKYPSRIKCAMLAWYALNDALKNLDPKSLI